MERKLGIIGGMGPLATVQLFEKIVTMTRAERDQDHIRILIDNNPQIPDRTAYITGDGDDPLESLVASARNLESMGADFLIMPCNTAHYFYKDIVKQIRIPFLNMIDETAKHIAHTYPKGAGTGLLATEGTCSAGVYDNILSSYGIDVIKPEKELQKHVTDLIYGIKSGERDMDLSGFIETVQALKQRGAASFILGCTELSVAREIYNIEGDYVDPLTIIARAAIEYAGKQPEEIKA